MRLWYPEDLPQGYPLSPRDVQEICMIARHAGRLAGGAVKFAFNQQALEKGNALPHPNPWKGLLPYQYGLEVFPDWYSTETKEDGSPVMSLDMLVNMAALTRLEESDLPPHRVTSEEVANRPGRRYAPRYDHECIIDPIDGTLAIRLGILVQSFQLAWLHKGIPVLGTIYDCDRNILIVGVRGGKAFANRKPIRLPRRDSLEGAAFILEGSNIRTSRRRSLAAALKDRKAHAARLYATGGSLSRVLTGNADGLVKSGKHPWDTVPPSLIAKAAGYAVLDLNGNEIGDEVPRRGLLILPPAIRDEFLTVLRP